MISSCNYSTGGGIYIRPTETSHANKAARTLKNQYPATIKEAFLYEALKAKLAVTPDGAYNRTVL